MPLLDALTSVVFARAIRAGGTAPVPPRVKHENKRHVANAGLLGALATAERDCGA